MATFYKPKCKCPKGKRCNCGATWSYITDIGTDPQTGKRKQKKKGGYKTKQEAVIAEAILQSELAAGTYVEEEDIIFEIFTTEVWMPAYESTGKVKINTIRIRKHGILRLSDYFAKLKMKSITRKMYQDAINDLSAKYAESTVKGFHSVGKLIFGKAVEMGTIKSDPTQYAILPKVQKTVEELEEVEIPKYLEKEELVLFLRTAENHGMDRDYEIFTTLAYTGLRVGELCALKRTDADEEEQTIRITKTCYNPNNNIRKYKLLPPKTKTSKRVISVEPIVLEMFERMRIVHNKVKMRNRKTYHDEGFIFAQIDDNNPGYPVYIKHIESRMARLLRIAGLNPALTPHSLRHTHCSLLAEARATLEEIMQRLGHKDDAVTRAIYLHITKPKKKEASQKFGALMQSIQIMLP